MSEDAKGELADAAPIPTRAMPRRRAPAIYVPPDPANPTPAQMLMLAVSRGDSIEQLKQLMDLRDRDDARSARMAFDAAIADAKAEIRPIVKNRRTDFANKNTTGRTTYAYEDFAAIAEHIDPILGKHGLSYRFRSVQQGQTLRVTCVLAHRAGHTEETTLEAGYDSSGNKNPIQAVASAGTYLQRYTLKMALGLSAAQDDDDGKGAGEAVESVLITPAQVQELENEVKKVGADRAAFLRYINCDNFGQIWAVNFDGVLGELRRKKSMAGGKGGTTAPQRKSAQPSPSHAERLAALSAKADQVGVAEGELLERYKVAELFHLTFEQIDDADAWLGRIHAG